MSVYIYVEGDTEVYALPRLLAPLFAPRHPPRPFSCGGPVLKTVGRDAAKILLREPDAHVFACPDLAPKADYQNTPHRYEDHDGLCGVLRREVRRELEGRFNPGGVASALDRFHPHPFRHDFEVILLASANKLKAYLGTTEDITRGCGNNPEDKDFDDYPKKVIARLFEKHKGTRYNGPYHCQRIVQGTSMEELDRICALCPCFRAFVNALRGLLGS